MIDVRDWLSEHGFSHMSSLFEENEIDGEVLFDLTDADLKGIGLALGSRKKLLKAIAASKNRPQNQAQPPQATEHYAERRQLTIMFVDMVGSTALSEQLDPEEMSEVIITYQNTIAGVVSRFEGMVARYMGDGVLAYFGWPRAHEDDAGRAIRAALEVMQAMQALPMPDGVALKARIGIATGLVVVGDIIGDGASQEETVFGETPNLAARLQAMAEPGQVVIAEATRQLTDEAFELRDLGKHMLKGFRVETPAYAVISERTAESRLETRLSRLTGEMVGRGHELDLILERWQQAKGSKGQLVLLKGEAGIGKSRIARAVIETTAIEDHTRINYQCSPYHADSSLYPAIQQITHSAGLTSADSNDAKLSKLEALFTTDRIQLIAAVLGLSTEKRYGPLDMDPQQQRRQTLNVLAEELIAISKIKPVLFIIEDAHWIDATTLELIELCLDQMYDSRILILITARPTFEHHFSGHPIVTLLSLNRLSREQVSNIVLNLAGGKPLPDELIEEIAQKTDGVPLFVEELTKTVLESKELVETDGRFELSGPLSHVAIPATLHDSLMARLDRLQPVKEVAQMAACIGREFEFRLLSDASALYAEGLKAALDRLVSAELIFQRGDASSGSYIFKHALVRDAAYESLLKTRRTAIHAKLLDALEQRDKTAPELLAYHATQASQTDKAIDYWELAGDHTLKRSAVFEAISHVSQAHNLLLTRPQSHERNDRELQLQTMLATASLAAYGYGASKTVAAFDRGLELAKLVDRPDCLFPLLYGNYVTRYIKAAGSPEAINNAQRLLDEAEVTGDRVPVMIGHRAVAATHYSQGKLASSEEHFRRAVDMYESKTDHALTYEFGTNTRSSAQVFLSSIVLLRGFPEQARQFAINGVAGARQVNHLHSLIYAIYFGPIRFNYCRREPDQGIKHADEMAGLAKENQLIMWQAYAATQRGWCVARQGKHNEGIALLQDGLKGMKETGVATDSPMAMGQLADACLIAGRYEEGLDAVERALAAVKQTNELWSVPESYRLKGELLLNAGGSTERAKAAFYQSLEMAQAHDAKWWLLRTAVSMARMPGSGQQRAEALDRLQKIYNEFTEGFECADLIDARTVLAEGG